MNTAAFILRRAATAAVAATAAFAITAGAHAAPTTQAQTGQSETAQVSFADLNLASAAGQKTMQRRMQQAARVVCDYDLSARDISVMADQARCMREAMGAAQVKLAAIVNRAADAPRVAVAIPVIKTGAPRR